MLKSYSAEKGIKINTALWPVRTAVSGKAVTPAGASEIMEILGKEESLARVRAAIEKLKAES
jgi:glutamyl-tRNA synthetase